MRFDLLDEYSTLVPFGLGVSQNGASQDPVIPASAAKRGTIARFAGHLVMLIKLPGALRQRMLPRYRNLIAKYLCLFGRQAAPVVDAPIGRPSAAVHERPR